ncbi:hypothetical protein BGW38_002718, partial [Lunasporangiospora selenospora]
RGIPSSPRRSHRGGPTKGKRREDEDDDGGLTRCVCNQQHHEGVMIQCETCKVWQHCPCVGLGDGEVTPDKYYCDSCRPQNHPYRVQNGVLVTNTKKPAQSPTASVPKAKTSKKRSTMNLKETSASSDSSQKQAHVQTQQRWSESESHEAKDSITTRASKRRRKAESTPETEDGEDFGGDEGDHQNGTSRGGDSSDDAGEENNDDDADRDSTHSTTVAEKEQANSSHSTNNSKSISVNSNKKTSKYKKAASKSSAVGTRSSSPDANGPTATTKPDRKSNKSDPASPNGTTNGKKGRAIDEDSSNDVTQNTIVPSTKRRKINKSDTSIHHASSPSREDQEDIQIPTLVTSPSPSPSAKEPSPDRTDASSKLKKTGVNSRANKRNHNTESDREDQSEEPVAPTDANSQSHLLPNNTHHSGTSASRSASPSYGGTNADHSSALSAPSPSTNFKKSNRKGGYPKMNGSRHSTPQYEVDGTPQPTQQPALPPTVVRYPSAKMSLQDMTKRTKQLMDYIARKQVEMSERHRKMGIALATVESNSMTISANGEAEILAKSLNGMDMTRKDFDQNMVMALLSPPHSAHDQDPGHAYACEEFKKVLKNGIHMRSGSGQEVDKDAKDDRLEQPSRAVSRSASTCPSISTSRTTTNSESSPGNEPLTPPPQNGTGLDLTEMDESKEKSMSLSLSLPLSPTGAKERVVTSLDMMSKLTADLVRFQERFGDQI